MKNIKKLLACLCSVCLALTLITGCSSSSSDEKTTKVIIGTQEMPNDEGIAKAKKYFEKELGVKVEYKKFDSGKDVATALMTEDIDFGLLGSCPAALSIAQGAKVEYIWTHEVLGSVESLAVKDTIKQASDLKGKKIATPFASTAHFSLLKYLEENNISQSDVTLLDMQPAEIYTAWESNQIDATYLWEPSLSQLTNKSILVTSEQMAKDGFMTANVELVTTSFAKKNPKLVKKYLSALNKSVELFKNSQDEAVSAISKYMELSTDDAKFQMSGSTWLTAKEQIGSEYMGTAKSKGKTVDNLYDIAKFLKDQKSITDLPKKSVFKDAVNPSYAESIAK
ncbi:MAG: ABC transporter substrate-binding protein [Thomasclavelia sp.]|jgi:taurine transport system substrate-binding protein|nr:ABC transporter substrate-binding protein [Thomasclavelia sp.]